MSGAPGATAPGRGAPRVRCEVPADLAAIHALHAACFPTPAEARLVDALRAAGRLALSLVAQGADRVVGHVAWSPVTLAGTQGGVGLAPLAVLPGWRRRGVGEQLVRAGLAACAQAGRGFAVVLGAPAYYARFGFAPAARFGLGDEYAGGDAFQALELRAGALAGRAGLVRYAPEFAALDAPGGE